MATPLGRIIALNLLAMTAILGACAPGDRVAADRPSSGVVDSALPIATLLHRFRGATPDTLSMMSGGASSPDASARALLAALEARDTAAVQALVLTRAEFAWLYYPHSRYTEPPYALGPELVWLTLSASSAKGAGRLLDRFGGQRLRFVSLTCADTVIHEGPNRILPGCVTRFSAADSAPRDLRLFSALLSRDGRYKFLSYANDL